MSSFITGVFLQFGVFTLVAEASSRVQLNAIGEGERGLMCRTDHQQCCNNTSKAVWLNPNGTVVPSTRGNSDFYTDTGVGFIRLNLIRNVTTATGKYCCQVPVDDGVTVETFCAQLFLPEPQGSSKTIQEPVTIYCFFYTPPSLCPSPYCCCCWWYSWCYSGGDSGDSTHYIPSGIPEVSHAECVCIYINYIYIHCGSSHKQ